MSERMDSMPRAAGLRVNRLHLHQFGTARSTRADAERFSSPPKCGAGEECMSTSGTMMPGGAPGNRTVTMAERFFNTSGPVVPEDHYCIPPLQRLDLDEVLRLIRQRRYFVLHAPRQTGEDLGPAGVARPAERGRRAPLRVRQCRDRADRAGRRGRGDADDPGGDIRTRARRPRRRLPGRNVERTLARAGPHGALRQALGRWSLNDPSLSCSFSTRSTRWWATR